MARGKTNDKNLLKMKPGPEMDKIIGEKLFGLSGNHPPFSTDMNAAMSIVAYIEEIMKRDKVSEAGTFFKLDCSGSGAKAGFWIFRYVGEGHKSAFKFLGNAKR